LPVDIVNRSWRYAPRVLGTRDKLLDAAEGLLDSGGVEAVTLREVGRRASVSHNAPYKHFASKESLLAAVAARDLSRRAHALAAAVGRDQLPEAILRDALHRYAASAIEFPARFKLIFGRWQSGSDQLADAARAASTQLTEIVRAAQERSALPAGDPDRLAALLRATAHGAADLQISGHLSPQGKGGSDAIGLIDDLLAYLGVADGRSTASAAQFQPQT
jgi:AcrR family transcriptional regulator